MHLLWLKYVIKFVVSSAGMQNQFTPEQLGVISSSALAYSIFELIVYSITLYISNITASMKTLDLVAFSGYKFVTINLCILISIVFKRFGYYLALLYTSISLCFFLVSENYNNNTNKNVLKFNLIFHYNFAASYIESKNFAWNNEHGFVWCIWKCSTNWCSYRLHRWPKTKIVFSIFNFIFPANFVIFFINAFDSK